MVSLLVMPLEDDDSSELDRASTSISHSNNELNLVLPSPDPSIETSSLVHRPSSIRISEQSTTQPAVWIVVP